MSPDFNEQLNGQLIGQRILLAYALGMLANMSSNPGAFLGEIKEDALDAVRRWPGVDGLDPEKTRDFASDYLTEFFAHIHLKD